MMKILKAIAISAALITAINVVQAESFMPWTEVMAMADTDRDQRISPAEVMMFRFAEAYPGFQPFFATHFMRFDTNADGLVDDAEFHAGMDSMKMNDSDMNEAFAIGRGFMPWDKRS